MTSSESLGGSFRRSFHFGVRHGRNVIFLGIQENSASESWVQGFWSLLPSRISCRLLVDATATSFYEIRSADVIGLGGAWGTGPLVTSQVGLRYIRPLCSEVVFSLGALSFWSRVLFSLFKGDAGNCLYVRVTLGLDEGIAGQRFHKNQIFLSWEYMPFPWSHRFIKTLRKRLKIQFVESHLHSGLKGRAKASPWLHGAL